MESANEKPGFPLRRLGVKFLVTGATGFVGSSLIDRLVAAHGAESVTAMVHEELSTREKVRLEALHKLGVRLVRCDLLELPRIKLEVPPFDVIYHLAAYVETEAASTRIRVNTDGTANLLAWLRPKLKGKRFVFTSTLACVDRKGKPTTAMIESTPCYPRTGYGRTKLKAEQIIQESAGRMGFDYTILRLCTILGPGFRLGGMFAVFPEMLRKNSLGARLNWPGRTSLLDIEDLVTILYHLPFLPESANEMYVLSNGEDPSFDELLEQIALTVGLARKRITLPSWFWSAVGAIASFGAEGTILPHSLRTFCWRVSLMVYDGIYADASKLNFLLPMRYHSVRESLRGTYESQPHAAQHR